MAKLQESGENYLETILMLQSQGKSVRSVDLACELGFTKPSISRALSILKNDSYVTVNEDGFINLTEKGKNLAEIVYERHQILTNFFVDLGVTPEVAAADACRVEHVISEETFEKFKLHYGLKK